MELPVPVYHGLQGCAAISGQLCRGGPAVDPSALHGRIASPCQPSSSCPWSPSRAESWGSLYLVMLPGTHHQKGSLWVRDVKAKRKKWKICGILPTNDIGTLRLFSNVKWDLGHLTNSEPGLSQLVPDMW